MQSAAWIDMALLLHRAFCVHCNSKWLIFIWRKYYLRTVNMLHFKFYLRLGSFPISNSVSAKSSVTSSIKTTLGKRRRTRRTTERNCPNLGCVVAILIYTPLLTRSCGKMHWAGIATAFTRGCCSLFALFFQRFLKLGVGNLEYDWKRMLLSGNKLGIKP